MNKLSAERRAAVVRALVEGNSVRATCRITGTAKGTVLRLLEQMGAACAELHDRKVQRIEAKRVQVDEIWSFVGCKQKNVTPEKWDTAGDLWTWWAWMPTPSS